MSVTNASLDRAINHVSAVDIGSGEYAHYADETSTWWVVTATELCTLCDYLDHDDAEIRRDAYSRWCAAISGREMPSGWSPERLSDTDKSEN